MKTLADDLRAELRVARADQQDLRARLAAAEHDHAQAEARARIHAAAANDLGEQLAAANARKVAAEMDRDAAAAAHLRLRNAALAWCAEMDRIRSVRATEVFAGRQEDELRMLVQGEAPRPKPAPEKPWNKSDLPCRHCGAMAVEWQEFGDGSCDTRVRCNACGRRWNEDGCDS